MKIEHGNVRSTGVARLDDHGFRVAYLTIVGDVVSSRHRRIRGDAHRQSRIASQHGSEATALGLARGVNAILVDAVL